MFYNYIGSRNEYTARSLFYHQPLLVKRILDFSDDTPEIFSYCAESRASALGVQTQVNGFNLFNLHGLGYDDAHYSHSRQFRSNIVDEQDYWKQVMEDAKLSKIK